MFHCPEGEMFFFFWNQNCNWVDSWCLLWLFNQFNSGLPQPPYCYSMMTLIITRLVYFAERLSYTPYVKQDYKIFRVKWSWCLQLTSCLAFPADDERGVTSESLVTLKKRTVQTYTLNKNGKKLLPKSVCSLQFIHQIYFDKIVKTFRMSIHLLSEASGRSIQWKPSGHWGCASDKANTSDSEELALPLCD